MGKNGVFTSDDFNKKEEEKKNEPSKAKIRNRRSYITIKKFFNPVAPKGKSCNFITYNKKSLKLELEDGLYVPNKSWSSKRKREVGELLVAQGFEDVSEIEPIAEHFLKKAPGDEIEYTLIHPDTPREKKEWRINGLFSVNIPDGENSKKEVQVKCVNNEIKVYSEEVMHAFAKKGWNVVGVNKIVNPEDKKDIIPENKKDL